MNDEKLFCFWIITLIISIVLGVWLGITIERVDFKKRLVKSGHAEYYLDANHNRQWRMKPAQ